jgi:hypothetical protein
MQRYKLEFILDVSEYSGEALHNSLAEFGEGLKVSEMPQEANARGKSLQINISTEDPAIIFDTCAGFGRIKSVKVIEG